MRLGAVLLIAALALTGCKTASPTSHACALVRYWADSTGTVADPDSGVTTESEVVDLARSSWPNDTGTAAQFVQLYDDLSSNMSDAEYAAEAVAFGTNCPT